MAQESMIITKSLSPRTPGSSILPDGLSDGAVTRERPTDGKHANEVQNRDQATNNILPDDALLEIFHFYGGELEQRLKWWWKNLTDVCRRWRHIIFASPRTLNLQLACTDKTPTRTSLDIWPPFPITISCGYGELDVKRQDNLIAALEHHDRIIQIDIKDQKCLASEKFAAVTRKPFPVLRNLSLGISSISSTDNMVLHEEFLGGTVPCLRSLVLEKVAIPSLPKLVLSATHLSNLCLWDIPRIRHLSPEAMATCLALLPCLKFLSSQVPHLLIPMPSNSPDRIGLRPPPTRAVLPALADFTFRGVSKYLEDFVARIDTPKLYRLKIFYFMDVKFEVPQLHQFIARTANIRPLNPAKISFYPFSVKIILGPLAGVVELRISCREPDEQVSLMAHVLSQLSPLLSHVEQLDVRRFTCEQEWQGYVIDPTQWFELFEPFRSLKSLHVHGELRPLVARALQELTGETVTDLLPALRRLCLEGPSPI